jgi:cobalamin biosynthesis Mg chelatase CobN
VPDPSVAPSDGTDDTGKSTETSEAGGANSANGNADGEARTSPDERRADDGPARGERSDTVEVAAATSSTGGGGSPVGLIVAAAVVAGAVAGGLWLRRRRRGPAPG